jgi:hypothetical protein
MLGCQQTDDESTVTRVTDRPAVATTPVPPLPSGGGVAIAVPALPVGEAPPPPGTQFVDVAGATTRERATYQESQYRVPRVIWSPMAYRYQRGMRVRWWGTANCGQEVAAGVRFQDGVVSFHQYHGTPTHCAEHLIAYETTLPPGNDAVHALRGPRGEVQPLPEVLPSEPPRRAPRRNPYTFDPWPD